MTTNYFYFLKNSSMINQGDTWVKYLIFRQTLTTIEIDWKKHRQEKVICDILLESLSARSKSIYRLQHRRESRLTKTRCIFQEQIMALFLINSECPLIDDVRARTAFLVVCVFVCKLGDNIFIATAIVPNTSVAPPKIMEIFCGWVNGSGCKI